MRRFLHGKAYIIGELNDGGSPIDDRELPWCRRPT